jgi:glyoxylase-like metal-dependent hydrolase (beta-lactamase superfamily II)
LLINSFEAGPWQTNCYVLAPQANSECIIIDPGQNALPGIKRALEKQNLKPIAILITHGHLDHIWSVFPVANGYDIPAFIHGADRHLLTDPGAGLSAQTKALLPELIGKDDVFAEPSELIEVTDRHQLSLAGLDFTVIHTPGHTAGSVIFTVSDPELTVFTGDTLFAGAIGRTDLPGSSPEQMNQTLKEISCQLPDSALIYPGHGPSSRMDVEQSTNQYLLRINQGLSAT